MAIQRAHKAVYQVGLPVVVVKDYVWCPRVNCPRRIPSCLLMRAEE